MYRRCMSAVATHAVDAKGNDAVRLIANSRPAFAVPDMFLLLGGFFSSLRGNVKRMEK